MGQLSVCLGWGGREEEWEVWPQNSQFWILSLVTVKGLGWEKGGAVTAKMK